MKTEINKKIFYLIIYNAVVVFKPNFIYYNKKYRKRKNCIFHQLL